MSKRKLLTLVEDGIVDGWDDPRMPTLAGLRRRGYTPEAIRDFTERIGMSKSANMIELGHLEHCLREDLNKRALRRMAVLHPLKLILENYAEGQTEEVEATNNPEDPSAGTRKVPFTRELWIEQDDFREVPRPKYFRLTPGVEVRLRAAYIVKCTGVEKDAAGNVTAVRATYDPESRGGDAKGRKIKGTIHWVSASAGVPAEFRLYDTLFTTSKPDDADDFKTVVNPSSLQTTHGFVEPSLASANADERFQFERVGYFCADARHSRPNALVFNRAVGLRDTWAKIEKSSGP
jgi:glutaminyl-tRNA synthetase